MTLLIASDPQELVNAQHSLIADIGQKIEAAKVEARGAERMKDDMIAARLSPSQAKQVHRRATDRVGYLVRVKSALEAGYCMMPDMPGDIIAVRTNRQFPSPAAKRFHTWKGSVPDEQPTRNLPMGEGRYISPRQSLQTRQVEKKGYDGKPTMDTQYAALALRDPDGLDRRFVRPEVISRTSAAMMTRMFDEIVCVRPTDTRRKSRDPIVLGRIVNGKTVSAFLIAWFVDSAEL